MLEGIFNFAGPIGGIDIDQHHAYFGGRKLSDTPLCAVRRPDTDTLTYFKTQRKQPLRTTIDFDRQLFPGVTQLLMPYHQSLSLGITLDSQVKSRTDGHR
ncbi:hypothetical protein L683_09055 [Pseudomonas aeruginosa WC55]|nr:hypothetical protein L683_09055 [Pseudomonas aeruginosa WC55]